MLYRSFLISMAVAGAAATAHADPPAMRASLDTAVHTYIKDDASYTAWQVGANPGVYLTPSISLGLRASYHSWVTDDGFDPVQHHHHALRLIPAVRLEGRYAWAEIGVGESMVWYRRSDEADWRRSRALGADISGGLALAPASWPVRPALELGLATGEGAGIRLGVSLLWRSDHARR